MFTFISILIFISRIPAIRPREYIHGMLVIWDVQTGAIIKELKIGNFATVAFSGDHMVAIDEQWGGLWTCSVLGEVRLDEDGIRVDDDWPGGLHMDAHWVYKGTLCFATKSKTSGRLTINIQELQPSDRLCPVIESFSVPPYDGQLSFSPVSFHAAFVTRIEVVILNARGSEILLYTKVSQPPFYISPGHFSPNGCLFACRTSKDEICVWKNTPIGYIPWGILQPRLPFDGFLFSPTTTSILTWGQKGIQLLYLGNPTGSLTPNENRPLQHRKHLVAYSTDETHIAVAQQGDSVITLLDPISGASIQSINVDIQIWDIGIANNTVFALGGHKLVRWDLEAGEIIHSPHNIRREAITETLGINLHSGSIVQLMLSNDCSQIAYIVKKTGRTFLNNINKVFLYDIKSQKLRKCITPDKVIGIKFSPDGCQLWAIIDMESSDGCFMQFEIVGDHLTNVTEQGRSWVSLYQSPCGYCIRTRSQWVEDPKGRKLLWLPPGWREESEWGVRWEGSFLALLDGHHPKPIIIKFQS